MKDTHPKAMSKYVARLRELSSAERGRILVSLTNGGRRMLLARLREKYPAASSEELQARVAVRLYGKTVARRALRTVPEDAE